MTFTIVPQDPLVKAVITTLEAMANPRPVGDGRAPAGGFPYTVVYSLDDEAVDGPFNDWEADVTHTIQLTTVGETPEQARMLQDANRAAMHTLAAPAGREVSQVRRSGGMPVERDPEEQPPLFYAVDVWAVVTTPA
jgi:hypothetical protein